MLSLQWSGGPHWRCQCLCHEMVASVQQGYRLEACSAGEVGPQHYDGWFLHGTRLPSGPRSSHQIQCKVQPCIWVPKCHLAVTESSLHHESVCAANLIGPPGMGAARGSPQLSASCCYPGTIAPGHWGIFAAQVESVALGESKMTALLRYLYPSHSS